MGAIQSMLFADANGARVIIGQHSLGQIRELSDSRALRCPACGEAVVLKAGPIVAPHFAHLAGSDCSHPDSEPETVAHRAGKALLADWAGAALPNAKVTPEACIMETGQRADVLIELEGRRVALEYQCADLSGREWLRRHRLYRGAGVRDLWILGAARCRAVDGVLCAGELEIALARFGAPLLFFDCAGEIFPEGCVARFRPRNRTGRQISGRFAVRPLQELQFPWKMLDWPLKAPLSAAPISRPPRTVRSAPGVVMESSADAGVARWLETRHHVKPDTLARVFGMPVAAQEVFACSAALWQAAVYYRFIDGQVGRSWWIGEVETWARRYLPLAFNNPALLRRALTGYQAILSAAGFLSLPVGKGSARIVADLQTLPQPPDPISVARLAAYRRSLLWEKR